MKQTSKQAARVPLKTALLLKKCRYPRKQCDSSYFTGKTSSHLKYGELLSFPPITGNIYSVAAPTIHETMDWLRNKKDLFVEVRFVLDAHLSDLRPYRWRLVKPSRANGIICSEVGFNTYEECCIDCIDFTLEMLSKKQKS